MAKTFKIEILKPTGLYFSGEGEFLVVKTIDFTLGILPNHDALISVLPISELSLTIDGVKNIYAISGGVIRVDNDNSIHLMVKSIERNDEIDVQRALASKTRAEERLKYKSLEIDIVRAEASLRRAINRISVAEKQ